MKTKESVIWDVRFYVAFILLTLAAIEKIASILNQSLTGAVYPPIRLLQYAAISLLFAIAMQLNQIRLSLNSRSAEPSKQ